MNLLDIDAAFENLTEFEYDPGGDKEDVVTAFCSVVGLGVSISELLSVLPRELPYTQEEFIKLMYLAIRAVRD